MSDQDNDLPPRGPVDLSKAYALISDAIGVKTSVEVCRAAYWALFSLVFEIEEQRKAARLRSEE